MPPEIYPHIAVLNHIDKLDDVLQTDGEQGSHERNNLWAKQQARQHPALFEWLRELKKLRDAVP